MIPIVETCSLTILLKRCKLFLWRINSDLICFILTKFWCCILKILFVFSIFFSFFFFPMAFFEIILCFLCVRHHRALTMLEWSVFLNVINCIPSTLPTKKQWNFYACAVFTKIYCNFFFQNQYSLDVSCVYVLCVVVVNQQIPMRLVFFKGWSTILRCRLSKH